MRRVRQCFFTALLIAVAACSTESQDKPQGVIPAAQQQALDKAGEVDELTKKRQEDMRKQLESID